MWNRVFAAVLLGSLIGPAAAPDRMKAFNDAKFGMFIHWGPYSLATVEASWPIMRPGNWGISEPDYRALPQRFNPMKYDPKAWVRLAKSAGQRYMVFTSKHHDGFCMFDSQYTNYKITKTPYGKDIVSQLAEAARTESMPLGFYYSPPDMDHPGFRDTTKPSSTNFEGEPARPEWPLYLEYMDLQLRELLTRYGNVFVIWFDGLSNQQKYAGARFHELIRRLQPATLINNRIGLTGDFVTPEQRLPNGIPRKGAVVGNVDPNDRGVLAAAPQPEEFQPWETCMTINNTWAYNKNDPKYKSKTQLIRALIDAASKGGNFLLNVGPAPDGTIQPEFEERLLAIGEWLKRNGESIYGTTYGPLQSIPFGRMTAKGKTLYLHVFEMPKDQIELDGLAGRVASVKLLDGGAAVHFTQAGHKLRVPTAGIRTDPEATVLALTMR
ncbi:MAG: alpha-L-fucosidase [Bryobacterales bacterium]|nr:alpha-L-fucosidase [Bryobacterales bacterium]